MKIFAIRNEEDENRKDLGYLIYYEKPRRFYIELPDDADPWETPLMEESFFDEKEWYLSLLMIGEDRIVSNSLSRDRNHKCFSYHAIAEDYGELEDKLTKIEEQVSQEQMVELLMSVLTEKQKEILKKVYWEQKTHKQIASMYGMSRSSVSDAVHKALIKISRSFDENGEPR